MFNKRFTNQIKLVSNPEETDYTGVTKEQTPKEYFDSNIYRTTINRLTYIIPMALLGLIALFFSGDIMKWLMT
jgi:hypothetical protein